MEKNEKQHSNVDDALTEQLLAEAKAQGIQKLVVGAVIKQGEKFLLLERVPSDFMGGLVELPSGTVDTGEHLLAALRREVEEETGLRVKSVLVYLGSFDYTSGSGKKTRQFSFLVETESGEIKLSTNEHCAYYLVAPQDKEFPKLNISEATREVLMRASQQSV